MAYVDPNQESPAVAGQQAPQSQQPVSVGGVGITGTQKAAATPGVNVPQQPSAQLKDYLTANAQQANIYGGNVASQLGAQTQAAGAAIQPAINTYASNLYTVPTNQNVNQAVSSSPSALTPQQTAAYQQELGASANAPNSAATFETTQPYQGLVSDIQNAVNQANLWNSGNNVSNITSGLQPFENQNATSGVRTLDALLLSQTPQALGQIQAAVAPAANLQGQLQAGATQADTALQNAIAQDTAATAAANQAAQTYSSNLTNYLNNAVTNQTQVGKAQNAQLLADINSGNVTPADLAALNITPAQWLQLQGYVKGAGPMSLQQYLTQTAPNINAANLATPTQYADVAALENILGGNAPVEPITSTTANEAGTSSAGTNTFDLPGAEIAALSKQAQNIVAQGNFANNQYQNNNHFGGMSPGDFNNYIAGLNNQLNSINAQIKSIAANAAGQPQLGGVATPGGGNISAGQIAKDVFPVGYLANLPVISNISSIANDIGSFFGLSEGGEIPEKEEYAVAALRG